MTEIEGQEIGERLSNHNWWHSIPISEDYVTDGRIPLKLHRKKARFLPDDLSGKRVLDVGAYDGFYSFEAERRGAESVVSVDIDPDHAKGFKVAKDRLDSDAQFVIGDIMKMDFDQPFDVVICYGVLHHVPSSQALIDKLANLATETLSLETRIIPSLFGSRDLYNPRDPKWSQIHANAINLVASYDNRGNIPTKNWVRNEIKRNQFEIERDEVQAGLLVGETLPVTKKLPRLEKFLPCRYILTATK